MGSIQEYRSRKIVSTGLSVLFFVVLSFIFTYPLLKDLYLSCRGDWDYFSFLYEIPAISLYEYNQFPLWNPYCGGGLPFIGNPQQGFPSPIFVLTSLFGVFAGLKISVWLHTFIGLYGTWLLGAYIGIHGVARFAPPILFMFAGSWAFHLTEGHIVWLPAAFLPLIMLAFLKGMASMRWFVAASLLESVMIYEGGTYVFVYSVLFLSIYALVNSLTMGHVKPVLHFIGINVLAAALAAPKLLPVIDLLREYPRVVDAGKAIPWDDFLAFFIERDSNLGSNSWEYGAYVGVLSVVLFVCSIATLRKQWPLVVSSLFMMLVACGNFAAFAPWTMLHELPFFRNFQLPTRSLIVVVFSGALLIGLYLTRWLQRDSKWIRLLVTGIVVFIGTDLLIYSGTIFRQATIPSQVSIFRLNGPTKLDKPAELYSVPPSCSTGIGRSIASVHQPFVQMCVPDLERFRHGAWSDQYLPLLQNRGVTDAYEPLPFARNVRSVNHDDYKGEHYLVHNGSATLVKWTPNKLVFHIRTTSVDRLVINQNFWKGWHTSLGSITNHNGLLAVDLPSGEYDLTITYLPASFLQGILVFLVAVTGVFILLFRDSRMQRAGILS